MNEKFQRSNRQKRGRDLLNPTSHASAKMQADIMAFALNAFRLVTLYL
jgi:hypothetical protein